MPSCLDRIGRIASKIVVWLGLVVMMSGFRPDRATFDPHFSRARLEGRKMLPQARFLVLSGFPPAWGGSMPTPMTFPCVSVAVLRAAPRVLSAPALGGLVPRRG